MTTWTVLTRLLCPWNSPGKNTGVGFHFLLQGDLLNPGMGPRSPALQVVSLIAGGFFTDWAIHSKESLTKETRSKSRYLSREIQVRLRKSRPWKSKQRAKQNWARRVDEESFVYGTKGGSQNTSTWGVHEWDQEQRLGKMSAFSYGGQCPGAGVDGTEELW